MLKKIIINNQKENNCDKKIVTWSKTNNIDNVKKNVDWKFDVDENNDAFKCSVETKNAIIQKKR